MNPPALVSLMKSLQGNDMEEDGENQRSSVEEGKIEMLSCESSEIFCPC